MKDRWKQRREKRKATYAGKRYRRRKEKETVRENERLWKVVATHFNTKYKWSEIEREYVNRGKRGNGKKS